MEEERGGAVGPFEDLEVIRLDGHADFEVRGPDRRARTLVSPWAGQSQNGPSAEGAVAAPVPRCRARHGDPACTVTLLHAGVQWSRLHTGVQWSAAQ